MTNTAMARAVAAAAEVARRTADAAARKTAQDKPPTGPLVLLVAKGDDRV